MSHAVHDCSVCGKSFELQFGFQMQRIEGSTLFFCSQACHEKHLFSAQQKACSACGNRFELQYAYQQAAIDGEVRYFCSSTCRETGIEAPPAAKGRTQRIAVLNQKGGTGKTTTSVNLAAGLAERGYKTLLMDLDAQGNVAVSLGLTAQRNLYHVIAEGADPNECVVNVGPNLDALPSNTTLAQAEVALVNMKDRFKVLRNRMRPLRHYDYIVMDCGPSLSVLNQNALVFADQILIPVSCDYLSLVGVKQILKTLKHVNELLLHPVSILGVVPTFYDVRTKISIEAVTTLTAYFKDRVLPPIRVNTKLKEAPSHKKTVFEYAPDSHGAEDYRQLVGRVIDLMEKPSALPDSVAPTPVPAEAEVTHEQPRL